MKKTIHPQHKSLKKISAQMRTTNNERHLQNTISQRDTSYDIGDQIIDYNAEDKTLPLDDFVMLINNEPLFNHNYNHVDRVLLDLKKDPSWNDDHFTLDDLITLLKAEQKDWEEARTQYILEHPSWKIREALLQRAIEYFNGDNRADHADIVIRNNAQSIQCQIVNSPEKNSFRLYRNSMDQYINHTHAFEFEIENIQAIINEIQIYLNYLKHGKGLNDNTVDDEEFEWSQETILVKISEFRDHWQQTFDEAVDGKDNDLEKLSFDNIQLFTSLFEKTKVEFYPERKNLDEKIIVKTSEIVHQ
jgi:hypothetical protein